MTKISQNAEPSKPKLDFCEGPVTRWCREAASDGDGEWIVLEFEGGGSVRVFTRTPLVWVNAPREKTIN